MMTAAVETTDAELLRAFSREGDEAAFAALVHRHAGLVFGAALRRTGNWSMAEETAQGAFAIMARKADALARHPAPAAWLLTTVSHLAARAQEKESNRRRLMNDFAMQTVSGDGAERRAWEQAIPHLDEAVAGLSEPDRQVLVLRYWQNRSFREIAGVLGGSAEACEKRASRAVAKLSQVLRRRGVVLGAVALASGLGAHVSAAAVPAAVLNRVVPGALAASKAAGTAGLFSLVVMKSTLTSTSVIIALLLLCGTAGWVAGRSSGRRPATGSNSESPVAQPMTGVPPPLAASQTAVRDSLRALLEAAHRDLLVATYDPAAQARAAARVARISAGDMAAAMAMASQMPGLRSEMTRLVLSHWATLDPRAACSRAAKEPTSSLGIPILADPLKAWAGKDPPAALAWLRSEALTASQEKPGGWRSISNVRWIFGAWALQDMPAAVTAFRELTDRQEIDGAITGLSEMAARAADRGAMLDAVLIALRQRQSSQEWMETARLVERWSLERPAEIAAWMDRQSVPESYYHSLGKSVLSGWLRVDAPSAVAWWMNAPGGPADPAGRIGTVVDAWAASDVFAAAEWLVQQPLDEQAAGAMVTLSQKLAASDPERAMIWALRVPVETARQEAVQTVVATWSRKDRAAAISAVTAADLSDDSKAKVLKIIGDPAPPP